MDAMIVTMAQSMQISEIASEIDEHDTRIWRVVDHYTNKARSRENLLDVTVIGIDKTSCTKGHKYVTLVVDFDTSRVIHVCGRKNSSTILSFKEDYQAHEGINSVVQLLKRSARGYRNIQNFMTLIYLRLGHLDFQLPT